VEDRALTRHPEGGQAWVPPHAVRPIAVCVVRRDDAILVFEGYDSVKDETFYRPLGGSIEFGESAVEALVRELREEIGAELIDLRYIGLLENIFTYKGYPGHEIVLVYEGRFASQALYEMQETTGVEDFGATFKVMWKRIRDFGPGKAPLYPEGLSELLSED
jgi:8-oxo-dGTP pyrophosphatase MutT (NUDIX family)